MGPNGSGKSTLAHALMGRPGTEVTAGSITMDGQELAAYPPGSGRGPGCSSPCSTQSRCPAWVCTRSSPRPARAPGTHRRGARGRMAEEAKAVGLDAKLLQPPAQRRPLGRRGEAHRDGAARRPAARHLHPRRDRLGPRRRRVGEVARRLQHATTEWGVGLLAITHFNRFLVELEADLVHVLVDGQHRCNRRCRRWHCSSSRRATPGTRTITERAAPAHGRARRRPTGRCPHFVRVLGTVTGMANGRPPGDGSDRSPGGLVAGREPGRLPASAARCSGGADPESVANESGFARSARASTPRAQRRTPSRRSGKPELERRQEGGGLAPAA